ncbi:MAG: hypothetical protein ABEK50_08950 [bacterium]
MQLLLTLLVFLAIIPVIAFGLLIDSSALWTLLCVGLIAISLYTMFSPGTPEESSV